MVSAADNNYEINSRLSLRPLVATLKKMIEGKQPGTEKLYASLVSEVEMQPELLQPLNEVQLKQHNTLVDALLASIFPPSVSHSGTPALYAVSAPFRLQTVYASDEFQTIFIEKGDSIRVADRKTTVDISKASTALAYNVILNRLFGFSVPDTGTSVHAFTHAEIGLKKYYELNLNARFVDVQVQEDFKLPEELNPENNYTVEELEKLLPLEKFQFEGLFVINVDDVTGEQVVAEIKNALIDIDAFSDASVYEKLQTLVESLIGQKGVKIGITPFFQKNGIYLYTDTHYTNSLLFRHPQVMADKDKVSRMCQQLFQFQKTPVLYRRIDERLINESAILTYYREEGAESLLLCPLFCDDKTLIGLLEVMSPESGKLRQQHMARIKPAIDLFALALEKVNENLQMQIDKTIKEHFTAIQPAVEWKFTRAAFRYLQASQHDELAKMENISFENVYPLYGSIDIRNSSVERNNAIQLDLLEQLTLAQDALAKAMNTIDFPLLKEIEFRISRYIETSSDNLLSDDEIQIYEFLEHHLNPLMETLLVLRPDLKLPLEKYFRALDPQRKIVYHHRKDYEDSITRINDILDRFIDQEQQTAQDIYPHYFERYFTDGVEFNIYIGQSLSPHQPFDELYVRNLKLWQLGFLARATRITAHLEKRLPLPLQTTQLILAQAIPLTVSFRRKERKFDVDGAYNIRYEIVKKRIDKVHIRDTDERLTQPGTIAIVYTQQKEMAEYLEYLEYLKNEKLITGDVEHLDLEDTQGISGLKAIRVHVNMETESTTDTEKKSPETTTAIKK